MTMADTLFESPLDRATFRRSAMFGGVDFMSARFVRHRFAPHTHDEWMIGLIHAGVKSFRRGRQSECATPNSLIVVNPGEMHTGHRAHGEELIYAALYVPQAAITKILTRCRRESPMVTQPVVNDQEIWRRFAAAHGSVMSGDDAVGAEEAMILGVSLLFTRYGSDPLERYEATCSKAIKRSLEFLEAHACDRVGLEDVSAAAGVTACHLVRLFQQHIGLTPYAYLTQIRIAKSQRLLRLGTPVAQVALDVGFADQAHFTKRFKQLTGATPAHYARSIQ